MPVWKKSPPGLVSLFERLVAGTPGAEPRKMFGYPACFVNGNMAAGLFEDDIVLKLRTADREEFLALGASIFAPMEGRVMKEFAMVPRSMQSLDGPLPAWLHRACEYAGSLPPKTKAKPATKKKTRRAIH